MSQRHVKFNMNQLALISAQAVGAASCVSIKKYPDGMYNKAFLMTMCNGTEVVAKVPNPNAGLPHLTTASQVASMEFAREVCGTPAPRVLAWSSKSRENTVGAEYIIMEKINGVLLSSIWLSMSVEKKTKILKKLSSYQQVWMSFSFKKYGSLYYISDIPMQPNQSPSCYYDKDNVEVKDSRFAVGPSVHRQTVDYGRTGIDFYRGPWNTPKDYCNGTGQREITCVKSIEHLPKPLVSISGRYVPIRAKKLAALEAYMKIFEVLLPTDSSLTKSHIWHSDLHTENIFVSTEDPTEIVGIIDWQAVALSPLYENAVQPAILDYDGPSLNGLERPEEPSNLQELDPDARKIAFNNWIDMTIASYYRTLIHRDNPRLYHAIEFRETINYDLLIWAKNVLIEGEAVYRKYLVDDLKTAWSTLPGVKAHGNPPYPFKFSPEEEDEIQEDYDSMCAGIECLSQIQQQMGPLFPEDGTVSHKDYDSAKEVLEFYKKNISEVLARNDEEKAAVLAWWPYDS